jgi:hypothetical protein
MIDLNLISPPVDTLSPVKKRKRSLGARSLLRKPTEGYLCVTRIDKFVVTVALWI